MALTQKQSDHLFYVFLAAAGLVNMIFAVALAKHYIFGNKVDGIAIINTIFSTEIMGVFIMLIKTHFIPAKVPGVSIVTPPKYGSLSLDENDVDDISKNIGLEYLNQGRAAGVTPAKKDKALKEAKRIFESIPEKSKTYPSALYNLIATNRELKDYESAIKCLNKLKESFDIYFSQCSDSERKSRLADLIFSEGLIYSRKGETDRAKALYEKSWRLDPTDYTAPYNLAILCHNLNLKEEYCIWYETLKKYPMFTSQIEPRLQVELNGSQS